MLAVLGISGQMEQMGCFGRLDDGRAITHARKISRDEISAVTRRPRAPDDTCCDPLLRQLVKDMSSRKPARPGQQYSHA